MNISSLLFGFFSRHSPSATSFCLGQDAWKTSINCCISPGFIFSSHLRSGVSGRGVGRGVLFRKVSAAVSRLLRQAPSILAKSFIRKASSSGDSTRIHHRRYRGEQNPHYPQALPESWVESCTDVATVVLPIRSENVTKNKIFFIINPI